MQKPLYTLMLVTHRAQRSISEYLDFIRQCAASGITSVQLREKESSPEFKLDFAIQLKKTLDPLNIPLIINDDLDLALKINASGVHLGQSDGSVYIAREKLGPHKCIGLSIETEEQLHIANQYPLDYVAASAVFQTTHKNNIQTIWGLDGLSKLADFSKHPLIGIGGINHDNLKATLLAGAKGAAIIGALHNAEHPATMARQLRAILET